MKPYICILIILFLITALEPLPPETYLPFQQYCQYYDYPVESHQITTQDGYILTYFRIQAKHTSIQSGLPVVYLQHGVIDSSDTFIISREGLTYLYLIIYFSLEGAPAFHLANLGYDVWLGNSRGNKHSLSHQTLSSSSKKFWEFSWPEMSKYDLPAAFQYIIDYTQVEKIDYVAHSQGTLIMFAALSEEIPIIKKYLNKFIALAPIFYFTHQKCTLVKIFEWIFDFQGLLFDAHIYHVFDNYTATSHFLAQVCRFLPSVCGFGFEQISDANISLDYSDRFPVIMGHYPAGGSLYDFSHFAQMNQYKEQVLRKFDYLSAKKNREIYGQDVPPSYDPLKIKGQIYLMGGTEDKLGDLTDIKLLRDQLKQNNKDLFYREYEAGHATFIWGKNQDILRDVELILKNEL